MFAIALGAAVLLAVSNSVAGPLVTLQYNIGGAQLRVTPASLSAPKGIAGSVLVQLVSGGSTNGPGAASLADGAYVQGTLRGPAFPARKVIGQVNAALLLPPIPLSGDYELDDIKLVDAATGATRLQATPNRVPVHVFDNVLISTVTSRPLTLQEIQDRGIVIDENNFRAVEFEVGFVLDGKTIPVQFPVVAPAFTASTEIIPAAELDARLAQANQINQSISSSLQLPPELEAARVNIDIEGINFQPVEEQDQTLALQIPPIPALMVIPGRIGFLNQFFSVQIFTENGAPQGSGLSVNNVMATLQLPPGPDQVSATDYDHPGDDPLRFARIGPNKIVQPTQPVVQPGPDGVVGTADDITRLQPGESGQGEFLVEALQEGLQVMNVQLVADLDGLPAGTVKVKGSAAGSVLVRNPKFSIAFSNPRTVRAGEPYDAFVTVLNTGSTVANLVQVTLNAASISGGVLQSDETVQLGTLQPGQSATARFHILSQRTGEVSFSNLTTSDDSVVGRFRLSMGIDSQGVALSPDTIGMPDFVNALPPDLLSAANRVLGQALSVNTAGQLPAGIINVPRSIITTRVLELAEAGQRLIYHDTTNRVLADLLLDWQGGRSADDGFDQILRTSDAGTQFRQALMAAAENADTLDATARLAERAPDLAGRSEPWLVASANDSALQLSIADGTNLVTLSRSDVRQSAGYAGGRGNLLVAFPGTNQVLQWQLTNAIPRAVLSVLQLGTNGTGQLLQWTIASPASNTCFRYAPSAGDGVLLVDQNCDGTVDSTLPAVRQAVAEFPPALISAIQDPNVSSGRPLSICNGEVPGFPLNYGTMLAVLFSKPMTQDSVNVPSAYALENGNAANAVQIQPGGRVALLNMSRPVGAIIPRTMTVSGVADPRGHPLLSGSRSVESDLLAGTAVHGRVVRADNSPASGIPVTLTMYDEADNGFGCSTLTVRVSQVFTDDNGYFDFDFIMSGMPYSVSATDTGSLTPEAVQLLLDSISDSRIQSEKLLQLANSPTAQNTLLQAFGLNSLADVVAKAEGLDRALLRDLVPQGSAREGTIVPVALRFRGRGVVTGQVVSSDGTSPISQAAVNLFPDPDSRELGRGQFSDSNGRFAFFGVPLGVFTIQAQFGTSLFRYVSGSIDVPGETNDLTIVLSAAQTPVLTQFQGRVTEADGVTGHSGAQVFIGRFDLVTGAYGSIVALATADVNGYWTATNVPVGTYDPVALSLDGKRKAERRNVPAVAGVINTVNLALQGLATVSGRVETSTGQPVSNALVAGGEMLVRSDSNGLFTLTGVPTGNQTISAGVERTTTNGPAASNPPFDFPRLGSASLDVLPGAANFVVVRLDAAGRIVGRVLDSNGQPVPSATVAIPQQGGFQWVDADANGNYAFENLPLKRYDLSAPAPSVDRTSVSGILSTLGSSDATQDQVQAAIGEAFSIFTGAADPLLSGQGATYNPLDWGFNSATLSFDGQTVVADIRFLAHSTISGTVLNGQGVPIGARVRLTGIGPLPNGQPSIILRSELNSDPALGTFEFDGQALVGDWALQAASPFFPTVISANGKTTSTEPNATNIVLQFPSTRDINGRLIGTVFLPNGSPASSNVNVKISFGDNFIIRTIGDGTYDTQIALPALTPEGVPGKGYSVEADDPLTGLRGLSTVALMPGITNVCNVQLIGKGALTVTVLQANGSPATNAAVTIVGGSFPFDQFSGTSDTNGGLNFGNLFAGPYSVAATLHSGPTTLSGRSAAAVIAGGTNAATVTFGPTATIQGTFVQRDLVTPVAFAQVAVGTVGFTTTGSNGDFVVSGLPLGSYRLVSQDPVTGIGAVLNVTLTFDGQTNQVLLVEQSRGTVDGRVVNSYANAAVPGAHVTISFSDGLTPPRTVSTGPLGDYSFPGTPAGAFSLEALDPVTGVSGFNAGTLPDNVMDFRIDVQLQPLATLAGRVFESDGTTPATNATVTLQAGNTMLAEDTDGQGRVTFADLPLSSYTLLTASLDPGQSHNATQVNLTLDKFGPAPDFTVRLPGIGGVSGRVLLSDGLSPAPGATVTLSSQNPLFSGEQDITFADGTGHFVFTNVPVGSFRLTAISAALGASFNDAITNAGQLEQVTLVLGASGTVQGRLVRQDGATPVPGVDVLLTFSSQSALPGRAVSRTDSAGLFKLSNIPVGSFNLEAIAPDVAGIARLSSALSSNGQVLDLGNVLLDEDDPVVVTVNPPDTSVDVPTMLAVDLVFNEAIATNSLNTNGIYIRLIGASNDVPATIQLLPDPTNHIARLVRLTPLVPLQSQKTYEVVVVDGNRVDALGNVIASGPQDLVGRPLVAPFVSRFTTADNDPPVLVSLFPTNGQIQIDPRAVMRLSFNEPIRDSNFVFLVTGTNGPVSGTASVGLNNLVLTFAPDTPLPVNASFTLIASNIFDLAGNRAAGEPFRATFFTLDTIGPTIASLSIADGKSPIAGGNVPIQATLAGSEPGASVRFTQDLNPIGSASSPPFRVNATLPSSGSTTIRAIATDQFGNDGPFAELVINVVSNQPPAISLARGTPAAGPLTNGQAFTLAVSATDDLAVSNIVVVGLGALSFVTNFSTGAQQTLAFVVPATALPGDLFQFRAQATDGLGATSSEAVLDLAVVDVLPPTVAILSPVDNTLLNPNQPFTLVTASSDNNTNHQLQVVLSGAVSSTNSLAVAAAPRTTVTNTFRFSLSNAPNTGVGLTAAVRATDTAGNTTIVTRSFRLPDTRPPQLTTAAPTNGAVAQSLWLSAWTYDFDEALDPASVTTNRVVLTNNATIPVPFSLSLANGNQRLVVTLPQPLTPGVVYTNRLLPGFTDISSNAWANTGGSTVPAEGLAFVFTTAKVLTVTPTNGTVVTAGQALPVTVNFEPGFGASFFRFQITGGPATDVNAGVSSAAAALTVPLVGTQAIVTIIASSDAAFSRPFALPPVTLQIQRDNTPPVLLAVSPTNAAPRQSLWTRSVFDFTKPLDPATATTNNVLVADSVGLPTTYAVALTNGNASLVVSPHRPLLPGVVYTNTLLPNLADASGNRWQNTGGVAVPPTGAPFEFTTASVLDIQPTNGAAFIAGQSIPVSVSYEPGLGAAFFRFLLDGTVVTQVAAGLSNTAAILRAPLNSTQPILSIVAANEPGFSEPLTLAPITLNVNTNIVEHAPVAQMADLRAVPLFDGTSAAAQRDTVTAVLNIGLSNWTLSAWIRTSASNVNPMTIAARYECGQGNCSSPDGNPDSYWELGLGTNGALFFGVRGDTGDGQIHTASAAQDLRDGALHHVAGVLNRQANNIQVFVDDTLAGSAVATGIGEVRDPVSPFTIGKRFVVSFASPQFFFQGNIHDLRVWNLARTGVDLLAEGVGPSRGTEPGLAGYWPLNEGFGTTAFDLTTNGNHLSLQGNLIWQPLVLQTNTADRVLQLQGFDIDNDPLTATVTTLPGNGASLFQTADGQTRDAPITNVPAKVINSDRRVILAPAFGVTTNYFFRYTLNDGLADSLETTVALAVQSPPFEFADGVFVAQPLVGLILPSAPSVADATNGLTLAQPQVGLTLPASPTLAELTNSLTVAQPQVGLILPTTMDLAELTNGLTLAQPQVGLILPVSPDLTSTEPGLTLAEPVVQLQFAPSAAAAFSRSGPRLALVQVQSGGPNPRAVVLEWTGPTTGTYTVETSTDLHIWAPVSAEVISSGGGVFQARCGAMTPQATFYRLRHSPKPLSNMKSQTTN